MDGKKRLTGIENDKLENKKAQDAQTTTAPLHITNKDLFAVC